MEARRKAGEVTYQWTGAVVELLLSRGRGVVHWPSSLPLFTEARGSRVLNSYTTREVRAAPSPLSDRSTYPSVIRTPPTTTIPNPPRTPTARAPTQVRAPTWQERRPVDGDAKQR